MKPWITPTPRIALGLLAMCLSLFIVADLAFGIVADRSQQVRHVRLRVAESLTAQVADLLRRQDLAHVQRALRAAQHGNPDMISAAVRDSGGTVVAVHGPHAADWARLSAAPGEDRVLVPLHSAQGVWGRLEMEFVPVGPAGLLGWLRDPRLWLALGLPLAAFAMMYLYLRRALTHLNPLTVVPERLRAALDGLTAGVALLDRRGRVVLANASLRHIAAAHADQSAMHGRPLEQAAGIELAEPAATLPWLRVLEDGQVVRSTRVYMGPLRAVGMMTCTPVLDQRGRVRGCLATVDDVTAVERSNEQLRRANAELERSRAQIAAQNEELVKLATRDPLTGLLNRRAFMDAATAVLLQRGRQGAGCVAVMMLDVDHFKSFNDRYGHAVGDEVLQRVARQLAGAMRLPDLVARYGGEEFCVLAEVEDVRVAMELAERMRRAVATLAGAGLRDGVAVSVTISVGVAVTPPQADDVSSLLNAADSALYEAKRAGRNRVVLAEVQTAAATLV